MNTKKNLKYTFILTLLLSLPLGGCATNDDYTADEQQGPGGMSSQGMGGPGGGGGGGGRPEGPPGMDKNDSDKNKPLPAEAFSACEGKKAGDYVLLILAEGKEIQATCQLIDDQMVAVPKETKKPERR